jgi:hypothetical protein
MLVFNITLGGDPQGQASGRSHGEPGTGPVDLAAVRRAVAEGFASGKTTAEIVRALRLGEQKG